MTRFVLAGALAAGAVLPAAAPAEAACVIDVDVLAAEQCPPGCRQFIQAAQFQVCLGRP